ncbi:hypothetical protein Y032_0067g51 [Ancylostoma ceylanicum]|uniref:SCP domain-containing protein n=1 Tax=Ancylostoma ceylanicum TaxID=53326 RepID=A0A016TZJ9_9BILA|nr:hypothetical protein Y032_0067g51 [Ancylostoma ceylanicum]
MCPTNNKIPDMDDGTRLSIMEKHNKYRSLLALGLLKTKKGYAHSASKMRQLDYDCVVEKSAYESAKKCSPTASSSGKYDENLYVIKDGSDVIKAIDSWWNEVYTLQMNEKEQKKTKNKYNSSSGIPNFANMPIFTLSTTRKRDDGNGFGVGCGTRDMEEQWPPTLQLRQWRRSGP